MDAPGELPTFKIEGVTMLDIKVDRVPAGESRALPVFSEVERLMERVRSVAFELFVGRGSGDGRALDDWLAAEQLIFSPDTEVIETDEDFEIRVPLEGFEPADVSVTATPRELIVKAAAVEGADESTSEAVNGRRYGLGSSDVYRRVVLPSDIALERVSATVRKGQLRVIAPKVERSTAFEVPVAA